MNCAERRRMAALHTPRARLEQAGPNLLRSTAVAAAMAALDAIPPLYALVGVTRCSECDNCRRWLKDGRHDYCLKEDAVKLDCTRCRRIFRSPFFKM
jgi:hypothetical protein